MTKRNNNYQYIAPENMVGWLANFADRFGYQNNITPDELAKDAGNRLDNILTIMERNKASSVEAKVQKYRELVGMDAIEAIQKESKQEAQKTASRISLSIR